MTPPPVTPDKQHAQGVHSVQDALQLVKDVRWSYALIAVCLAVTLWYTVTVRDKVESWVDVQVVFKGAPENLVISDGLINKLAVRVRAARGLSRSLTGRDATVVVDLSAITRGSNAIAVTRDMLPFNSAYEVMEVSPSRIQVVADIMAMREIELETSFSGKLAPDLFVKSIKITPPKVMISGADSLVSGIARVRIPVPLSQDVPVGESTVTVAVPAPTNVAVAPPQVTVDLEVGVRTRRLKLTLPVTVAPEQEALSLEISPDKVTIVADIPESVAKEAKKLADISAQVTMGDTREQQKLPVTVTLPENAALVSVAPPEVTVSPSGQ